MAFSVVIDPGHGGDDGGAVGNGIVEKDLTLAISKIMYDEFKRLGIPVYITRSNDETLVPSERVRRINNAFDGDVILISNHINAGGGRGSEVIYALRDKDTLSNKIINNIAKSGQVIRGNYQKRSSSNPSKDYYFVLRDTPKLESIIVEYGFLDNEADAEYLKNNYKRLANVVVDSILEYKGINSDSTYIVKSGDTLYGIAKMYNISVDDLKAYNNLTNNNLSVNQVLKIPFKPIFKTYKVQKGDTLYSIAKKFNISLNDLKTLNKLNSDLIDVNQSLYIK